MTVSLLLYLISPIFWREVIHDYKEIEEKKILGPAFNFSYAKYVNLFHCFFTCTYSHINCAWKFFYSIRVIQWPEYTSN